MIVMREIQLTPKGGEMHVIFPRFKTCVPLVDAQQKPSVSSLERMAGTTRLELATSAVTGQRSNQLNYVPAIVTPTRDWSRM